MNESNELKRAIRVLFGDFGDFDPTMFLKEIAIEYPEVINKVSRKLSLSSLEESAIEKMSGLNKVSDIKTVREFTGMSLKEAKEFCEEHYKYDSY